MKDLTEFAAERCVGVGSRGEFSNALTDICLNISSGFTFQGQKNPGRVLDLQRNQRLEENAAKMLTQNLSYKVENNVFCSLVHNSNDWCLENHNLLTQYYLPCIPSFLPPRTDIVLILRILHTYTHIIFRYERGENTASAWIWTCDQHPTVSFSMVDTLRPRFGTTVCQFSVPFNIFLKTNI